MASTDPLRGGWAYPINNNPAENAIRPFVIGRKNGLFSATPRGADASANLYSLIETAKANGLEPHAYLTHVFTQLPNAQTVADIEALLPWAVKDKGHLSCVYHPDVGYDRVVFHWRLQ
jgi:hypothetical protein